jgi:hypothetical protein
MPIMEPLFIMRMAGLMSPLTPGQETDQRYFSAERGRFKGSGERARAAVLENVIGAVAAGEPQHFFLPVWEALVIDAVGSAQGASALDFFVARRSDDDARARRLAKSSPAMETPPVPRQSTVSPGFTGLPDTIRAFQAVTPAQGSVAASSNDNVGGMATTPSSCSTIYSASVPSRGLPSAGCARSWGLRSRFGRKCRQRDRRF